MNLFRWLQSFFAGWNAPRVEEPTTLPGLVPPGTIIVAKCPYPLSSDNGTRDDCKAKRHCGCEDRL